MQSKDRRGLGFGLYIHWPFCQAKCPYCDFNSHVSSQIDETRWKSAYLSELSRTHAETSDAILTSVFFGGGTPSLMSPDLVASIIDEIRRLWRINNDLEISLEANPTSSEADKFRLFSQAGVNRLSMGLQALNNADLNKLGRLHTAEEAKIAFEAARDVFVRVSFDLIYARQDQTTKDWEAELTAATDMAVDHLSLYQLTIEPGTAFGARHEIGKLRGLPDEEASAEMYDITQSITSKAGMSAYEISNHARPGCESRHNLIYWRGGDYIGIGPGAHGRLTVDGNRYATSTGLDPVDWLRSVEIEGSGELERTKLSSADQIAEYVMMSLRLTEGLDLERLKSFQDHDRVVSNIEKLVDQDYLILNKNRISVMPKYRILLNAVLREVLI